MTTRVTLYLNNGVELGTSIADHRRAEIMACFSGAWGNNPNRGMVNIYGEPHMLVNAACISAITMAREADSD